MLKNLTRLSLGCLLGRLACFAVLVAALRLAIADPSTFRWIKLTFLASFFLVLILYAVARRLHPVPGRSPFIAVLKGLAITAFRCLRSLVSLRNPSAAHGSLGDARKLGYLKSSNYTAILAIIILGLAIDIPVAAVLIKSVKNVPVALLEILHLYIIFGSVIGILVAIGDKRSLSGGAHLLTGEKITLSMGHRLRGEIARDNIHSCSRLGRDEARRITSGCKFRSPSYLIAALADTPNIELRLARPVVVESLGTLRCIETVAFYLDAPAQLESWIAEGTNASAIASALDMERQPA